MKTIKQLNHEAGEEIASSWLRACERILADGRTPAPLTQYSKDEARLNLVSDRFYEIAQKENKNWWVSEKNWKHIALAAECYAKTVLRHIGAERYPLTLAHFTKGGVVGHVEAQIAARNL